MECEVCRLLDNDLSLVFQTDYWKVFVMNDQLYLGRCVVSCKRHCPSLSDLTKEEWGNFREVAKKLEFATKKAFGATLFNWGCLMNDAFKKQPFNPHVHWHFRPRYEKPVNFSGIIFNDPNFGVHYTRKIKKKVSVEMQVKIAQILKTVSDETMA